MQRTALTLLPLLTLLLTSCATPGHRPYAAGAGPGCEARAAMAPPPASGAMAGMPMHESMHASKHAMHERMHGQAGGAAGEHRHGEAAQGDCAQRR